MRDFLNFILGFIGSTSLTDDEFSDLTITSYGNDVDTFEALKMLLIERNEGDPLVDQLKYYFLAKGVGAVEDEDIEPVAQSNIFIGSAL